MECLPIMKEGGPCLSSSRPTPNKCSVWHGTFPICNQSRVPGRMAAYGCMGWEKIRPSHREGQGLSNLDSGSHLSLYFLGPWVFQQGVVLSKRLAPLFLRCSPNTRDPKEIPGLGWSAFPQDNHIVASFSSLFLVPGSGKRAGQFRD